MEETTGAVANTVLTSSMLDGVTDMITSNLGVLLPVGITILGIMVGVSLIPRIVYKFL